MIFQTRGQLLPTSGYKVTGEIGSLQWVEAGRGQAGKTKVGGTCPVVKFSLKYRNLFLVSVRAEFRRHNLPERYLAEVGDGGEMPQINLTSAIDPVIVGGLRYAQKGGHIKLGVPVLLPVLLHDFDYRHGHIGVE